LNSDPVYMVTAPFFLGQAHDTINVIEQLANNHCGKLYGRFFDCTSSGGGSFAVISN